MNDSSDQPELTVTSAGPQDADRLASLMFLAPSREAVAMAGSAEAAERFQVIMFRTALEAGTSVCLVAENSSGLAGFAEVSLGSEAQSFATVARAAVAAMGLGGALRAGTRWPARLRVNLSIPEGGVHLIELQVAPELRNRGIGSFLLARVDELALAMGAKHISLTTATDNPVRGLYERKGYRLEGHKTNARYQRITGSEGRVLMVKQTEDA